MTSIAVIIGRCIAGCLGAILIYSALFLYKEEEGGLENRIEQWWQKIRDLHAHAISRETAFLKVVSRITSKGFDKLFGQRLFGPKAVAASMCYSQAAIFLVITIMYLSAGKYSPQKEIPRTAGLCLFFLFIGSLSPFIHRQSQKLLWLSTVLIATFVWPFLFRGVVGAFLLGRWTQISTLTAVILIFAVACDFLFICLTRVMLARAAQSNSFIKIATLAIGNACLAVVLFIVPHVGASWFDEIRYHSSHSSSLNGDFLGEAAGVLSLVSLSNSLDALVSLSWFFIAIMMLLHRFVWPLIERPVYALFRHRVFSEQKKLVFFSGVALVGLAIPRVGQALENVVKAVHD